MRIQQTSRMLTGWVATLSLLTLVCVIVSLQFRALQEEALRLETECLRQADLLAAGSDRLTSAARAFAATGETRYADDFFREANVERNRDQAVAALEKLGLDRDELVLIQRAKRNSDKLIDLENAAMDVARKNDLAGATRLVYDEQYQEAKRTVMAPIDDFRRRLGTRLSQNARTAEIRARWAANTAILTAILNAVAVIGALRFYRRRVVMPLADLDNGLRAILSGQRDIELQHQDADSEIGDVARSLETYRLTTSQVEDQRWIKTQVTDIAGRLQRVDSLQDFGQCLLSRLVPLLDGGCGAFYRFEEASGRFRLSAGYGYTPRDDVSAVFAPGEGLVGQAAVEQVTITLNDVPPGYLRIASGLGEAPPRVIVAVPITSLERTLAVIEVAAFTPLNAVRQALLDEVRSMVALNLQILQRTLKTEQLLEQTRQQAGALHAQQDSLRTANEALEVAKLKAEEATEMKSMFLANMSHEIRTPMNAIIGLAHLALKTPLTPKQRDYLSKIHNAGTSLLTVINDVLDFSKIEAGKLAVDKTEFRLDEVIAAVTTVTGQKAHEKDLEFLVDVPNSLPQNLLGDPLRLGQIITNLVNNAVKFTEHGEVRLKAELLEQTGTKVKLQFSVRDTGIGMTAEQAARLFQPFTQADMTTTRRHGGTGLGLTICKRLVELLGGQIWLESEPGRGSTFFFTTWLDVSPTRERGRTLPERLPTLNVLVVDDNAAAREILTDALRGVTHTVDAVGSGPEGIAAIKQQDSTTPYDVVFMDWRMPGVDGLQATSQIRHDTTLQHPPAIVMVTAFGREEVHQEAEELQVDGFLVKPVTASMLVDALVGIFAPPSPAADGTAALREAAPAPLQGVRLLVAEDNEINQQVVSELLQGAGATVVLADNGLAAVEKLEAGPFPPTFDMVLMDVQMPEMDGYQATTRIRADPRLAALPIIAMTAHATIEERQRCLAVGMNGHVTKPLDPAVLFETIRHWRLPRAVAATVPPATVVPSPEAVGRELSAITGLRVDEALARVGGNRGLYEQLLRRFAAAEADAAARLATCLQAGDHGGAENLLRALRGVAGNLGAIDLQEAAAEFESRLSAGATPAQCEALQGRFAAALERLVGQIRAALGCEPVPPAATADAGAGAGTDPSRTRAVVVQMRQLLANLDAAAGDCLSANRDLLCALLGTAEFACFEQHIQDYAFQEALERLMSAARTHGVVADQ